MTFQDERIWFIYINIIEVFLYDISSIDKHVVTVDHLLTVAFSNTTILIEPVSSEAVQSLF